MYNAKTGEAVLISDVVDLRTKIFIFCKWRATMMKINHKSGIIELLASIQLVPQVIIKRKDGRLRAEEHKALTGKKK